MAPRVPAEGAVADRTVSSPLRPVPAALLVLVALLAGSPVLFNDFAWDDTYLVQDNRAIEDLSNVADLFEKPWASGVGYGLGEVQNRGYYRPVALASMALDRFLAGGADPVWFHATNLLIHALAALALYAWLRAAARPGAGSDSRAERFAFGVAVLWAVHPVHTEAVALITYRTSLLAGLFTFLGLWVLVRPAQPGGTWPRALAGATCFATGLLSKETMLVFPALLFLSDAWAGLRLRERWLRIYLPLAVVAALWFWLRSRVIGGGLYDWFEGLDASQKALMVPRVFYLYVRLVLLPYPLCPFYDWYVLGVPDRSRWYEPDILAGAALLVAAPIAIVWTRRRAPRIAFGLAFFLVGLLPVSHIVPFFDAAAERFLYVPAVGLILVLVEAVRLLARRWASARCRWIPRVAFAVACAAGLGLTVNRLTEWRDSETILRATRRDFPDSVSANLGLGRLLMQQERHAEAVIPLRDVTRRSPRLSVGFGLLAAAQALSGDVRGARDTLTRAPLPEPRLPSAAEIARQELLARKAYERLREIGL